MPTTIPKPREMQRRTALARLDAEALLLDAEEEHGGIDAATQLSSTPPAEFAIWLETLRRIVHTLDVPIGLTVEQTAERLSVTVPTVRRWLKVDLLRRTAGRKPIEIEPRSLLELERALMSVRAAYPSNQWAKALAAYLHDRDLQRQDWALQGRREFERGEFVER